MSNYLKYEFTIWMKKQKKSNGDLYKPNTINQYTSALKNSTAKFKNLRIKNTDLFNYDTVEEFEKVHNMLISRPDFEDIDTSSGNKAYSNGMKMYLRFLRERQGIVSDTVDNDIELEEKFEWTGFYIKLADAILKYKNDRKKLLLILNRIFDTTGIKNSLCEGEEELKDVCPFTIFGIFNKGSNANRNKLLKQFAIEFGITETVPTTFLGSPMLNPMNSWFFHGSEAIENGDIDNLWELFEAAIMFADGKQDKKYDVIRYYDKVIKQKCVKWNVTMGLYWIRPWNYLPLDDRTRKYCKKYNIYDPLGGIIGNWKQPPEGTLYLEVIDKLKNSFSTSKSNKLKSFPKLSLAAWIDGKDKSYPSPIDEVEVLETKSENKEGEKRYWWLNANPKFWSFSEIGIGEEVEWTLYNDNGNKRHVFQNFLDAREGDIVIGYESTPVKRIVALGKVSRQNDGKSLYIEKTESLTNSVEFNDIKNNKELQNMEYIVNPNGSFFKLTEKEYNVLMDMIREQNPLQKEKKLNPYNKEDFLRDVYLSSDDYDTLKSLLKRKKNIILQGAPGVGKTFAAKRLAYSMIGYENESKVMCVQFHQSYSYEDFIMGYKPYEDGFKLEFGVFYNFCKKAENKPDEPYFFIIDEINRGNLSKIFGELLMLIEADKRGQKMTLAYNGMNFSVPNNLYIIGMMNTADRSLAMIDYALRRRFSFYSMKPAFESEGFKGYQRKLNNIKFDNLIRVIQQLNETIIDDASLGEGFVIGHSYFCGQDVCTDAWLKEVIEFDLIPILEEYWFDDNSKARLWADKMRGVLNG